MANIPTRPWLDEPEPRQASALDQPSPWRCPRCASVFTSQDAPHDCPAPELIYLASPYSHDDPAIVEERFEAVCAAAGRFMAAGRHVYSPIAHTHPIAKVAALPTDFEFWQRFDEAVISRASELWVLMLDGWAESRGVGAEVAIARRYGVGVRMVAEDAEVCRVCDFTAPPATMGEHRSSHEARPFA